MRKLIYNEIEKEFGLPARVIVEMQKRGALSKELDSLGPGDMAFLQFMQRIWGNKDLIRIQLSRITGERRVQLITTAGDFNLKVWEKWLLGRFTNLYKQGTKIKASKMTAILDELRGLYGTKPTSWVISRAYILRDLARRRVREEH